MASYLYFFCTHCRARNPWPANYVGKTLTCPACQQTFVDDDPYWPADEPQPKTTPSHLQTLAAEEELAPTGHALTRDQRNRPALPQTSFRASQVPPRSAAGRPKRKRSKSEPVEITLTADLQPLYDAPGLQQMQPPQRILYCLLVKTFQRYTGNRLELFIALFLTPFFLVGSAGLLWFLMGVFYYLSLPFGFCLGASQNTLLLLIPMIVVLYCCSLLPIQASTPTTLVFEQAGKASYFHMGKMGDVLDPLWAIGFSVYTGLCIGAQVGFLYFLKDPLESGKIFDIWESILVTLDNLLHGLFLGAFESFDIRFTEPVRHSTFSAIWFFLFRLAFDAIVLLLVLQLFRRVSVRAMMKQYPYLLKVVQHPATPVHVGELTSWIEGICLAEKGWLSTFPDELIFLALASEYLKGNDSAVREFACKFSAARISPEVKQLFVDETGTVIFSNAAATIE